MIHLLRKRSFACETSQQEGLIVNVQNEITSIEQFKLNQINQLQLYECV